MLETIFYNCLGIAKITLAIVIILLLIAVAVAIVQAIIDSFRKRKIRSETLKALEQNFDNMIKGLDKLEKQSKKKSIKKVDKKDNE